MSNLFSRWAKIASPALLVVYPLAWVLLAIALILMVEDYRTSFAGYNALPTAKAGTDWVPFAVAALPQAGQIVTGYIAITRQRRWSTVMALSFLIVDLITDVAFKSGGDTSLIPLALAESVFIFTVGSELLFTLASGFIAEATDEFLVALGTLVKALTDGVSRFVSIIGDDDDKNRGGQRQPHR